MAETPADPATEAEDAIDAEGVTAPLIGVEVQYIKDLSFENPAGPESAAAVKNNPEVSVEVSTSARQISNGRYEVCLIVHGKAVADDSAVLLSN